MAEEDWDLYAVVRSYTNAFAATAAASTDSYTTDTVNPDMRAPGGVENMNQELAGDPFLHAPPPGNPSNLSAFMPQGDDSFQGLEEIYKEQHENTEHYGLMNTNAAASSLPHRYNPSCSSVFQELHNQQQQYSTSQPEKSSVYPQQHSHQMMQLNHHHHNHQQQQHHLHVIVGSSPLGFPSATPQPIRSRRRKNQQAKMIHRMTQEELSGDSWAWRKYGQKPIKGSPFPRNYYRCSTSKGCIARRQVERCPTDPNMYVVSYSGQHSHPRPTHRSSLAGSTRTKNAAKPSTTSSSSEAMINNNTAPANIPMPASSSSPASGSSFAAEEGPDAENQNAEEEEEGEGEGWDVEEEDEDDDDGDDDNSGDGEILIPNTLIDHY